MPTSRPRHTLTETDQLREVLDRAQALFPDASSRKAALEQVIRLGDSELRRQEALRDADAAERRGRIDYLATLSPGNEPGLDFSALRRVRHEEDA
jgi:hypothetical protein